MGIFQEQVYSVDQSDVFSYQNKSIMIVARLKSQIFETCFHWATCVNLGLTASKHSSVQEISICSHRVSHALTYLGITSVHS